MIFMDQKQYYLVEVVAKNGPRTEAQIIKLIKDKKIEGELIEPGKWALTKVGMIALGRMDAPKVPEPEEKAVKSSVQFLSPKAAALLGRVRKISKETGVPIRSLAVVLIERGLEDATFKKDVDTINTAMKRLGL